MTQPFPTHLGDLEFAVLEFLWDEGAQTAKSVHERLGRRRRITLNTIQSTLKRLYDKGLLERRKVSHAHVYSARLDRTAFGRQILEQLKARVAGAGPADLVSAFVDMAETASLEELEELEQLVARRIAARRRGESS